MLAETTTSDRSIARPNTTLPAAVLTERYRAVRRFSEKLIEPLAVEDCVIQSMPDASPTNWHLAHTTWFFDRMVLRRTFPDRRPARAEFDRLFNSYYDSLGDQFPRAKRGVLSRPTVAEIHAYRQDVDDLVFDR
ncbi:MAG: DinB family protein, partial [Planctomycetes bacterium]|nr:DinB family protein [Planctomycetota bacterium]